MKRSMQWMTRSAFVGLSVLGSLGMFTLVFAQQAPYSKRPDVEKLDYGKMPTPQEELANIETVKQFLAAVKTKDAAKIGTFLADNVAWRPTGQDRLTARALIGIVGKDAVIKELMTRGDVEYQVLRSVAIGPIVMNERDDQFPATPAVPAAAGTPARAAAPARTVRVHAGIFLVDAGRIREWTDYSGRAVSPEEQKANIVAVNALNDTYKAKDIAKAGSLLAEVLAQKGPNGTWATARLGKETQLAAMRNAFARGDVDYRVNQIRHPNGQLVPARTYTMGPVVLHERDDLLAGQNGVPGRWLRVQASVFYMQDGKLVDWSDYRITE